MYRIKESDNVELYLLSKETDFHFQIEVSSDSALSKTDIHIFLKDIVTWHTTTLHREDETRFRKLLCYSASTLKKVYLFLTVDRCADL